MGESKSKPSFDLCMAVMAAAAALWVFLFRHFFLTPHALVYDAGVYYEHVKFFLDNITKGIYPLWDPFRDMGTANSFYLRRIGEFNPAYWIVALLHGLGLSTVLAYQWFLGIYFCTGMWAFYLLARRLFKDSRAALVAALLLMFSSLGLETYSSYVVLLAVPGIWFAYFSVAFIQSPSRLFLLGAAFCLMVLLITYVPFLFLSLLGIFAVCFVVLYGGSLREMSVKPGSFLSAHRGFALFCALAVASAALPGALWYKDSMHKEGYITHRNGGDTGGDTARVALDVTNEGGINTALMVDGLTAELNRKKPGDAYVPLFLFLAVLTGAFTTVTRQQALLFLFGLLAYLIGTADACGLHRFLYTHVFLFRYFRNLHFYLPLAVIPAAALFAGGVMDALLEQRGRIRYRHAAALAVIAVHAAAACFFAGQEGGMTPGTTGTVLASGLLFLGGIYARAPAAAGGLLVLLIAAILAQPVDVFSNMDRFYTHAYKPRPYEGNYAQLILPADPDIDAFMKNGNAPIQLGVPYFSTPWFHELYNRVNPGVLAHYLGARFLLYDRVQPIDETSLDFDDVQKNLGEFSNTALVSLPGNDSVPLTNGIPASPRAALVSAGSPLFKVLHFDANSLAVSTDFPVPKFLVYNANYHTGWKVFCDGVRVPLVRSNIAFQGLWVPAGSHVLTWRFGGTGQYLFAFGMMAVFWGVVIFLLWLAFRKRKS